MTNAVGMMGFAWMKRVGRRSQNSRRFYFFKCTDEKAGISFCHDGVMKMGFHFFRLVAKLNYILPALHTPEIGDEEATYHTLRETKSKLVRLLILYP